MVSQPIEPFLRLIKWCWVEVYQEDKVGGDFADRGNQMFTDQGNAKDGNILEKYRESSGVEA